MADFETYCNFRISPDDIDMETAEEEDQDSSFLIHLPLLSPDSEGHVVLGGQIRQLTKEEFHHVDSDYQLNNSAKSYWKPHVWVAKKGAAIADFEAAFGQAMLIHFALLAVTGNTYPSPALSSHYVTSSLKVIRHIGRFDRSMIASQSSCIQESDETMERVIEFARNLKALGLTQHSDLFLLLKALSITSTQHDPKLAILAEVAALELFLAREPSQGITATIISKLQKIAPDLVDSETPSVVKKCYKVRSDLLHGRRVAGVSEDDRSAFRRLLGALTIACLDKLARSGQELSLQGLDQLTE